MCIKSTFLNWFIQSIMLHAYLDNYELVYFIVKVRFGWKPQKPIQVIQTTTSAISTCNPQISAAASLKDLSRSTFVTIFSRNRGVFHVRKNDMGHGQHGVSLYCTFPFPLPWKGLEWNDHIPHDVTSSIIILPGLGWIWPHCKLNPNSAVFGESSWNKVTMRLDGFTRQEFNRIHSYWGLQLVGWMKKSQ